MRAEKKGAELVLHPDVLNEQRVLAAAVTSPAFRKEARRHAPDVFQVEQHRPIWQAIREAEKRGLEADPATLARLSGGAVDVAYVASLVAAYPDAPAEKTIAFAVAQLLWDRQRRVALTGPVNSLLEAIQSGEDQERCRGLARAVGTSFDGWGERRYLLDPEEIVRTQMEDLRARMEGRRVYPFGIPGLDYYDPHAHANPKRRIIMGTAPGLVTIVTASTQAGKSTTTARAVLGLARLGRRVLYGAWEVKGGMTLELLACMSLGWSRTDLSLGFPDSTPEERGEKAEQIRKRMLAIGGVGTEHGGWVRFMANPFRRQSGERTSNERNLDIVAGYVADSGADVFVADLWERCLANDDVSEEKRALFRQQAIAEELDVHCILLAQQKKEVAQRVDKKPTVEGIKGSGAWGEIADNVIGVHRPYLWKPVPDTSIELDVLKQRFGKAPLAVEFDWDADRGMISGGRSVEYEQPLAGSANNPIDKLLGAGGGGRGGGRR